VGSNTEARHVKTRLLMDPAPGLVPVGYLSSPPIDGDELDHLSGYLPCLGDASDLAEVVRTQAIDSVIISVSAFGSEPAARMIGALRGFPVDINVAAGLFDVLTQRILVRDVSGVPLILVKGVSLSPFNLTVKRAFDLVIASSVIVIGLPLWLGIVAAIRLTSRGPVFYLQERVGRRGERFMMYKFRSMCADAEARQAELLAANEADGPIFKMAHDPRITPVGRWLRKFSLDEFPQLLNVMRGEMSLVGPRPLPVHEADELTESQRRREEVRPGLTGIWQVSGRSRLTFDEMIRLDLLYIENWSVTLDLVLILRTVPAVLGARGAY
jgi:exopolysaccharide biosynthesis polyprenyl glycosylphosphotransferase